MNLKEDLLLGHLNPAIVEHIQRVPEHRQLRIITLLIGVLYASTQFYCIISLILLFLDGSAEYVKIQVLILELV
jgi:hypothetical protein